MKKNLMSVLILALVLVNLILTEIIFNNSYNYDFDRNTYNNNPAANKEIQ